MNITNDTSKWLINTCGTHGDGNWTSEKLLSALSNATEWALLADDLGVTGDCEERLKNEIATAFEKKKSKKKKKKRNKDNASEPDLGQKRSKNYPLFESSKNKINRRKEKKSTKKGEEWVVTLSLKGSGTVSYQKWAAESQEGAIRKILDCNGSDEFSSVTRGKINVISTL